jgi:hypothetical protein
MHPRPRLPAIPARLREGLRRVVALGCGALVLSLGLLAVLPEAHAWLHATAETSPCCARSHGSDPLHSAGDDAGCVVELFSQGIEAGAALAALPLVPAFRAAGDAVLPDAPAVCPPRYLHQPERGPPAGTSANAGLRR